MREVYFYQVSDSNPYDLLRNILIKSRQAGWRVAVRCRVQAEVDLLDRELWLRPKDGFLPHGKSGGSFDAEQPILLTTEKTSANRPDAIILFAGADLSDGEIDTHRRVSMVFRSSDAEETATARLQWSRLSKSSYRLQFWAMKNGKWVLAASENCS